MSEIKKMFIVFIVSYITIRIGFLLTGFYPLRDLPGVFGFLVDLAVWACVWLFFLWLIPKIRRSGRE